MLRTFEFRTYMLRTREARDYYARTIYPRHLGSFPLFGIKAHGFWTPKEGAEPEFFALVSYAPDADPRKVAEQFMQSKEFAPDIKGFDPAAEIMSVNSTFLDRQQALR